MSDEPRPGERLRDLQQRALESGDGPAAKRELAAALRDLLEALPWADLPAEDALRFAAEVRGAHAAALACQFDRSEIEGNDAGYGGMTNFVERSPIVGLSNPLAPPFEITIDHDARVATAHGRFGAAFEGGPGVVHGGFLAAVIDEVLGSATLFAGTPGVTGELTVRYHAPTPIHVPIVVTGRLEERNGRRLTMTAEVLAAGERTSTAKGLFIAVDGAHFAKLDEARRARSD